MLGIDYVGLATYTVIPELISSTWGRSSPRYNLNVYIYFVIFKRIQHSGIKLTPPTWAMKYFKQTWSISKLLVPWLFESQGHHQQWYWLCNKWILVFHEEGFQQPLPSQCLTLLWSSDEKTVLSLEILVASDFDQVVGIAIYYLQYHHM